MSVGTTGASEATAVASGGIIGSAVGWSGAFAPVLGERVVMVEYDLREGFLFEDRDVLLPWNATTDELRGIERPALERPNGPGGSRWYWRGGRWLGGLKALSVSTDFGASDWPQVRLRGLHVALPSFDALNGSGEAFRRGWEELAARLGPPDSLAMDDGSGRAVWRREAVVVRYQHSDFWGVESCVYVFLANRSETSPKREGER